jgi:hypothetical protein
MPSQKNWSPTNLVQLHGHAGIIRLFAMDYPLVVLLLTFVTQSLSARAGAYFRIKRRRNPDEHERHDLDVILGATLTLLGLIIAFSFSMAVSRYDQRKNCEEEEANAIGTEYLRVGLLPAADATKARDLLRKYLRQRVLFYVTRDKRLLEEIDAVTGRLQDDLWSAVQVGASASPTPLIAVATTGMNDVLNAQGYTRASWWNRIPTGAWALMILVAICSSLLFGYTSESNKVKSGLYLLFHLVVAISFFLIADLDSPRNGIIHVKPQNLLSLSSSIQTSPAH